jgi:predicted site-specific integrase-resolvase
MERIVAIGEAADVLGVSLATLRRWEAAGTLSIRRATGTLAKNLERLAASSAVSACGEARSGAVRKSRVKRASKKREPNGGGQLCAA